MAHEDRLELHLLRHADAGNPDAWHGDDAERPLSGKGRRQAARLGAFLASVGFRPDAIVSSPKVRARETAEIVAEALALEVRLDDQLAGPFDVQGLAVLLGEARSPRRPLLVGHDPDFSDLLGTLVGGGNIPLRKGAMARVDLDGDPGPGAGVLRWLVPPDVLPTTEDETEREAEHHKPRRRRS